ncbi:serine hydrolase [Steroidobacter sp.]|uniref:serine hydrolase n=1 Tax=Steroidobacter sp. TaxID=1978227 RepID=UPI001A4FEFAE|nr:serine hydrolase [Steroidobacter sp.]MBL8267504.1 serine hydrolase [Steroidobacter sp.]
MPKSILKALIFAACASHTSVALTAPSEQQITAYAEHALSQWQAPGMSIAVVKDGQAVYVGGVGVREQGKPERMDADTLFTIASVSKAFTGMSAAMAVERGQIVWDQPIIQTLPSFRLYDPYVTAEATIRDLLAHRVGVSGNYVNGMALTREQMVGLLRDAKPAAAFRTRRVYSNLLYAAAGEAVANAAGMSWDDHMRTMIFEPLGMSASSTRSSALAEAPNRASSHVRDRQGAIRIDPFRPRGYWSMDNHAPAGGINSTARDMARWLEFQVGDGEFRGRRLLSARNFAETHADQIIYQDRRWNSDPLEFLIGFEPVAYTLGWHSSFYQGRRTLWHGGGFRGHGCIALLDEQQKLGIFVFANSRDGLRGLSSGVAQWILDRYLELPERDWSSEQKRRYDQRWAQMAQQEKAVLQRPARRKAPSAELQAYAGRYVARDSWEQYELTQQGGRLRMNLQGMAEPFYAELEPWQGDAFRATWNEPVTEYEPAQIVSFTFGAQGRVHSMLLYRADSAQPDELYRVESTVPAP